MIGYSEKELLGMSFKDITHPDNLALDLQRGEELTSGAIPVYSTRKTLYQKRRQHPLGAGPDQYYPG